MTDLQLSHVQPTLVTYPAGSQREEATVLQAVRTERGPGLLVVTEVTPFHPLDPLWPDQPADHGQLHVPGLEPFPVSDTVTVAQRPGGPLLVGEAIDARRDEAGVVFAVGHVLDGAAQSHLAPGTRVTLSVDAERRLRLSAAHTACHLLAYALNEVTHELWRKPVPTDSRGHHDLDAATCVHTSHDVGGSFDRYRLGKSLRRRGFEAAAFVERLPQVIDEVNDTLAKWIAADAAVRIECAGPRLSDRRHWFCEIPDGTAHMPCGGTHVRRLAEIRSMRAVADYTEAEGILTIRNHVAVADR